MGCGCNDKKKSEKMLKELEPKRAAVGFCDVCDPCNYKSDVKLCSFVVPTLEEGRYFRNAFVFVQEDDSVYYIDENRSEIPFGSRPKFIDNFDPEDSANAFKNTIVFDLKSGAGYVYGPDGKRLAIALTATPITSIEGGDGIAVQVDGGKNTISIDAELLADIKTIKTIGSKADKNTQDITSLKEQVNRATGKVDLFDDTIREAHDLADNANQSATVARTEASAANALAKELKESKQDKLTAGDNITIRDNVISATDTTYSPATTEQAGLMTTADREEAKKGFDHIGEVNQANSNVSIEYKRDTSDENGSEYSEESKYLEITGATAEKSGVMTADDKKELTAATAKGKANEKAISAETTAREKADTELGGRIDTEASTREQADTDLGGRIDTETQARTDADTALGERIDAEEAAREKQDGVLDTAIKKETSDRKAKDTEQDKATQANATAIETLTGTVNSNKTATDAAIAKETADRKSADTTLQGNLDKKAQELQKQIDAITSASDVEDVVGTKAELDEYETSKLFDNNIIKVLKDESQDNATTYYRWDTETSAFTLIGSEGPFYTIAQTDTKLNTKQNKLTAGENIQIVGDTISATDTNTTYTAGTGLSLKGTEFSVDSALIPNTDAVDGKISEALSSYATKAELTTGLGTKQNTLKAGTNIKIDAATNTISATDTNTTYKAGEGLKLAENTFSVADTIATKTEVDSKISTALEPYATTEDMTTAVEEAKSLATAASSAASAVDTKLGSYATTEAMNAALAKKQNTLKQGKNITIGSDGTISATADPYTLPAATKTALGGVKVGGGLSVTEDGTLSANVKTAYTLPAATKTALGGVKVGDGISVGEDGTISVSIPQIQEYPDEEWKALGFTM